MPLTAHATGRAIHTCIISLQLDYGEGDAEEPFSEEHNADQGADGDAEVRRARSGRRIAVHMLLASPRP